MCAPVHAALWIYYPAAYITRSDKSDGVNLVETTGLISVSRNDRQIYTFAYTLDQLDGDQWKYTQHTGLISATWPLGSWTLSAAAAAINGKLEDVPPEFAPLNHGWLEAVRLTKQEGNVNWGLLADSYDEPTGLHIQHGGILGEWRASNQFSTRATALVSIQNGQQNDFSTTFEGQWKIQRSLTLHADFMVGQTSLPFSWSTLIVNNTPAKIDDMWGVKCDWAVTPSARVTAGYRFTGYDDSDAKYVYAGLRMRFLVF